MKTLVCILNQTRSLDITWNTLEKHILLPFDADLCLAIGSSGSSKEEKIFKEKAKYFFAYEEPEDYATAFEFARSKESYPEENNWRLLLEMQGNWLGGIKHEKQCGCGAIFMFYRWWLLYCLRQNNLIDKYDRFIITRSDYFYIGYPSPESFDSEKIYIPEGEDYGGLNDRHMVVPKKHLENCLDLIRPIFECPDLFFEELKNDKDLNQHHSLDNERHLNFMMKRNKLKEKVERFEPLMYTVRSAHETSRWSWGVYSSFHKMFIKYHGEYHLCKTRFFEKFLRKCEGKNTFEIILNYLQISNEILFGMQVPERPTDIGWGDMLLKLDSEMLKKVVELLVENIENWAKEKSPVYLNKKEIFTKEDLQDKKNWYTSEISNAIIASTGGRTGIPFEYLKYNNSDVIEWENYYDAILDEFNVVNSPNILYFMPHNYKTEDEKFICIGERSILNFVNHGSKRNPVVHYVNFELYRKRQEEFYEFLFNYINENNIDVFYTSPIQVNSLCDYMKNSGATAKVGYLLSSTGGRFSQENAIFLFEGGHFDHICDHMRCRDGGASFFTCKYRNYHLMDNLAWCEEGPNQELICTDYFNLASPFVKYWNGDYCRIAKDYQRCECGRIYRDFEFLG